MIGWLLTRQAEVALAALDGEGGEHARLADRDRPSTRASSPPPGSSPQTVLPRLAAERQIVEATTLDLMELPEEAF